MKNNKYKLYDNLFSNQELNILKSYIIKYERYLHNEMEIGTYKHARYNFKDRDLSYLIFSKLKSVINDSDVREISHKWYITKYFPDSGSIDYHIDGSYSDGIKNLISKYTVLIYLNDDFDEGETVIKMSDKNYVNIIPVEGSILVMKQDLLHSGVKPKKNSKYILRSDIMISDTNI